MESKYKLWTDNELTVIKELYANSSTQNLLHVLQDRTLSSIKGKASKLGIKKVFRKRGYILKGSKTTWKPCLSCGKTMRIYGCRVKVKHFCSNKCARRWRAKNFGGPNNPLWKRIKRTCVICEKEFWIQRKQLKQKGGGSYCSKQCLGIARSKKMFKHNPMSDLRTRVKWSKIMDSKEVREKRIRNTLKALLLRPTSLERKFLSIIREYNLPYRYVGDGSFLIGYKNPDFINNNGEKKCIEVRHDYWYSEEWKQKRIEHFRKWGWECIVFKGSEVDSIDKEELRKRGIEI